jgi:predicted lipoprotein with Yx(FWY)xxD motif
MLNLVLAVLFLLACACGGYSDAPGLTTGDGDGDGDGDDVPVDGDGDGDGDGEQPDAGTPDDDDDGTWFPDSEANLRFAEDARFGSILVDKEGRPLYMYLDDAALTRKSKCVQGVCPEEWPPFDVEEVLHGRGIDEADIDRFKRDDNKYQVTYKGYPLYYHAGDDASNEVTGNEIDDKWFVARDYLVFMHQQALIRPEGSGNFATPFLVDGHGRALYIYKIDKPGLSGATPVSSCNDTECLQKWPIWTPESLDGAAIPSSIDRAGFGTFKRADGKVQGMFRGWPLYYYAADETSPGTSGGYNVGEWNVVAPVSFDGTVTP